MELGGKSLFLPLPLEMPRDQDDDREATQSRSVTNHTVASQGEQGERRSEAVDGTDLNLKFPSSFVSDSKATMLWGLRGGLRYSHEVLRGSAPCGDACVFPSCGTAVS